MSSALDRAREEAQRLANEMRSGVEKVREKAETKLASLHGNTQSYNYAQLVHQIRTAHLIILAVQVIALYLEADNVGLTLFLIPFLLILGNGYVIGNRWYFRIDGRNDLNQLIHQQNPQLKIQYGIGLFGGFILALLTHFVSPSLEAGMNSFLYNLAKYLSVIAGGASVAVEVYEGAKGKSH